MAALLVSLSLMLAVGAALGIFYTEEFVRYAFVRRLCAEDDERRARAIEYVTRHGQDARLVAHVRWRLDRAEGQCRDRMVQGLNAAGLWGPGLGEAYFEHLDGRLGEATAEQRSRIAASLARIVFERRAGHDEPRVVGLLDRLLADEDAGVRYNALSLAAALAEPVRSERIERLVDDPDADVAHRAYRLRRLTRGDVDAPSPAPPSAPSAPPAPAPQADGAEAAGDVSDEAGQEAAADTLAALDDLPVPEGVADAEALPRVLQRLAAIEAVEDGSLSDPPALDRGTPPLFRLHIVRASAEAAPLDLMPVFRDERPTLRDLATVTALQRFEPGELRGRGGLAAELVRSFNEQQRWSGTILAAMLAEADDDGELLRMIRTRHEQTTEWVPKQHYRLAMYIRGESEEAFDPADLLRYDAMPRTTVILAMLHAGDLRGLDWLLNPVGRPGIGSSQGLRLLLDTARYHRVLEHYLPDAPRFDPWTQRAEQTEQVETLRDWYLMSRHALEFDAATRRFGMGQ